MVAGSRDRSRVPPIRERRRHTAADEIPDSALRAGEDCKPHSTKNLRNLAVFQRIPVKDPGRSLRKVDVEGSRVPIQALAGPEAEREERLEGWVRSVLAGRTPGSTDD